MRTPCSTEPSFFQASFTEIFKASGAAVSCIGENTVMLAIGAGLEGAGLLVHDFLLYFVLKSYVKRTALNKSLIAILA
jgi:hypothetical protein